ncbi:DmsE family decaheme c-type cytochrome [Ketobacter sp.]|uniref:DmsE family decaheme c-type cytochrome n=1 Tax=Ketobacter sp. TaxID=2083498 RepID=UPI000F28F772|nr:DmsE family decaheme c-type cytochrome [Ketobacter sp.]RLU00690.1 MAG: DmsE family decaheme c-type cytochrome [Ketobacter sp.]
MTLRPFSTVMKALAEIFLLSWLLLSPMAWAQDQAIADQACLQCHTVQVSPAVHGIFANHHGAGKAGNSGFCSQCHGGSAAHRGDPLKHPPDIRFGEQASAPHQQNEVCLDCHKGQQRMAWSGSAHEQEQLACASCHSLHPVQDPVLAAGQQADRCFDCHRSVQAKTQLPSTHPTAAGQMQCSDCHNPHGSPTPASLTGVTLNDTCFGCHAEKRGPFLFEHAPAAEDCGLCHDPHGSINRDLLTNRTPFLCQQCHSAAFHPSQLLDGSGLPAGSANMNLLGGNCLNCHSQVHGSNHPSGGRLTR